MTGHELLGKYLAALKLGGGPGRTDNEQALAIEVLSYAFDQRSLGTDHGQINSKLASEVSQSGYVVGSSWKAFGYLRNAGVSRSTEHLDVTRTPAELPSDGVFAASRADHKYIHTRRILTVSWSRRKTRRGRLLR